MKHRKFKPIYIPFIILFVVGLIALFGWVTMLLWNWLMPEIFGLTTISFWQAAGLLLLAKIFFGGFEGKGKRRCKGCCHHKGDHKDHWKERFRKKWENMSEEDRKKYKKCWGDVSDTTPDQSSSKEAPPENEASPKGEE